MEMGEAPFQSSRGSFHTPLAPQMYDSRENPIIGELMFAGHGTVNFYLSHYTQFRNPILQWGEMMDNYSVVAVLLDVKLLEQIIQLTVSVQYLSLINYSLPFVSITCPISLPESTKRKIFLLIKVKPLRSTVNKGASA